MLESLDNQVDKMLGTVNDVTCEDGSVCGDGYTCCMMSGGQYQCCALPYGRM